MASLDDPAGNRTRRRLRLGARESNADGGGPRYRAQVTFELPSWCILLGTVKGEDGTALVGVAVGLIAENGTSPIVQAKSGPDGRFALQIARGLVYSVVAEDPGRMPAVQEFDTTDVALWDLGEIVLGDGATLKGRVVTNEPERKYLGSQVRAIQERAGRGLSFGSHTLVLDGAQVGRVTAEDRRDGDEFEIVGLEPGEHRIELDAPWLSMVGNAPTDALVVTAPASGLVFDPTDPEVWVIVRGEGQQALQEANVRVEALAVGDPRGRSRAGSSCFSRSPVSATASP
jgi:hypothetical protein